MLAVPYRLLGSSPSALAAGALLVNGLSLVGIGWIAKRRGGVPLMLCMLLTSLLMVRALGFEFLATPWNPWITVLPYALLVMLTWAMTCGERWALPVAALVATFVVQTHVGYAVLALPLAGFGALWLLVGEFRAWQARRTSIGAGDADAGEVGESAGEPPAVTGNGTGNGQADGNGSGEDVAAVATEPTVTVDGGADVAGGASGGTAADRRARWTARPLLWALAAAGVVLFVAWLPPVVQQFTHEPGNLGVVVRWFGERGEEGRTLGDAWAVVSAQYAWNPEWLTGEVGYSIVGEPFYVTWPRIPVLLVFVVIAAVAGWRRPGGDARRLLVVWGVASALAALGVLRTIGLLYAYRLKSTWPLAAIIGAFCLWVGWVWLAERWPRLERRVLVPFMAAAVVVVAGIDIGSAVRPACPRRSSLSGSARSATRSPRCCRPISGRSGSSPPRSSPWATPAACRPTSRTGASTPARRPRTPTSRTIERRPRYPAATLQVRDRRADSRGHGRLRRRNDRLRQRPDGRRAAPGGGPACGGRAGPRGGPSAR